MSTHEESEREHLGLINEIQDLFENAIRLQNGDLMHAARVLRDRTIQHFVDVHNRYPEQDRKWRYWR